MNVGWRRIHLAEVWTSDRVPIGVKYADGKESDRVPMHAVRLRSGLIDEGTSGSVPIGVENADVDGQASDKVGCRWARKVSS